MQGFLTEIPPLNFSRIICSLIIKGELSVF